ncbi:MAG: extracellular solute-binding protein [Clostridia bacterium]|nr:extracellular solute-binding protein [Clostridia bacterium]
MKKWLCAAVAAVVGAASLFSFAGCGGDGRIKVRIGMWPDSSLKKDNEMYEKWEQAFEAAYPQYDIVADRYEYSAETIVAKATAKQLPTVFQTYFTEPQKLIENGWVADITDELNELGWLDKMDADMRDAVSANGRCYGVPRDGYGMGLFLNLNMLYDVGLIEKDADGNYKLHDETGKPLYPTTFDEIRRFSEEIVETYDDTYGLVVLSANNNGGWQFSNMAWNFGCEALQVKGQNGKYTANLNDPAAVRALEWIQNMATDGLIYPDASLTYADWYAKIGSNNVAMAFCGSDALMLPVTTFGFNRDDIAFVPMPTGDGQSRYSLYGGTPYVFASNATKEQIKGALLFLKYMGRSPETDDISISAIELGHQTAKAKGMPIIQTIRPWTNAEFLEKANELDTRYVNVNRYYYDDFFKSLEKMKRAEEPYYCQDMYDLLDKAIQNVLAHPGTANCKSLLDTANSQFQNNFLNKIK